MVIHHLGRLSDPFVRPAHRETQWKVPTARDFHPRKSYVFELATRATHAPVVNLPLLGAPESVLQNLSRAAEKTCPWTINYPEEGLATIPGSPLSHALRSQAPGCPEPRTFLDRVENFSQCTETGDRCRTFACSSCNINNDIVTYIVDLGHVGSMGSYSELTCAYYNDVLTFGGRSFVARNGVLTGGYLGNQAYPSDSVR